MQGQKIVILGTGGTIAGRSAQAGDNIGYTAAQVGVAELLEAIPGLEDGGPVVAEQVAQLDSKDMGFAEWARLAARVAHHLERDDVQGVVITHGTDTLEETAYFLQALILPVKPVVLTCAMRPASSLAPDGPQNVKDALAVVRHPGAGGVVMTCAGEVHSAVEVQKVHTYRLDAFSSGDAGPLAYVEEGAIRLLRNWPHRSADLTAGVNVGLDLLGRGQDWPSVEIVTSHAGAGNELVRALVANGVDGIVVAATGNGTVHERLEAALLDARRQGVSIMRASRCANGRILPKSSQDELAIEDSGGLNPVKARILLLLRLLGHRANVNAPPA
ncbi:MAG: asparaginase [Polaromonas sp.]|nr:asparaginase [Polaromonas sp.]